MSTSEDVDPHRRGLRLPRRDDLVVAAPYDRHPIAGVVVSYAAHRVSVRTEGQHGVVRPEFGRFTWNKRKRAWICWPQDVVRAVRIWDRLDDQLTKPNRGVAQIGDCAVLLGIGLGWVVKQNGAPTPMTASGMMLESLRSYTVSTARGHFEVTADNMTYNSSTRVWSGKANA